MRRPVAWIDKKCASGPREVRVKFHGGALKWQFRSKGSREWDYQSEPSEENWLELETKILQLMQRGHLYEKELALTRRRGLKK